MTFIASVLRGIWRTVGFVVFIAGVVFLFHLAGLLWEGKREEVVTVVFALDGVAYLLPLTHPGPARSPTLEGPEGPLPDGPFRYADKHVEIVIKDRELFIDCVSRYKAKPGDIVSVRYPLKASQAGDVTITRDKLHLRGRDTELVTITHAPSHVAKPDAKAPASGAARPPACP